MAARKSAFDDLNAKNEEKTDDAEDTAVIDVPFNENHSDSLKGRGDE